MLRVHFESDSVSEDVRMLCSSLLRTLESAENSNGANGANGVNGTMNCAQSKQDYPIKQFLGAISAITSATQTSADHLDQYLFIARGWIRFALASIALY